MSVNNRNRMHANCQVLGATGGFVTGASTKGVLSATRTGVGVYRLVLEQQIDPNVRVCAVHTQKALIGDIRIHGITHIDDATLDVFFVNAAGAAQDVAAFGFTLFGVRAEE